jgi:hypothetical protein
MYGTRVIFPPYLREVSKKSTPFSRKNNILPPYVGGGGQERNMKTVYQYIYLSVFAGKMHICLAM